MRRSQRAAAVVARVVCAAQAIPGMRAPGLRTPACASRPSCRFGLCLTPCLTPRSARSATEWSSGRWPWTDWRSATSPRDWDEVAAVVCGAGEPDAELEGEGSSCQRTRRLAVVPKAAFFDLLRHQRDAGAAAATPGEHPSACRHDYT